MLWKISCDLPDDNIPQTTDGFNIILSSSTKRIITILEGFLFLSLSLTLEIEYIYLYTQREVEIERERQKGWRNKEYSINLYTCNPNTDLNEA
jgi:hypothetical protein